MWKYCNIIMGTWELLSDSVEVFLYYHGILGIITRWHGNIPTLSLEPGNFS
jgi:hypothetical protein